MVIGDADRDRLFELLSRQAALGRLDVEELERRVERVIEAQTLEDAEAVLADLSPLPAPIGAQPHKVHSARGHGEATSPGTDWTPTNERFRDPRTARVVRVWTDSVGGRHYISEP